uniref:Uncharacterized protein n=1 Tax=Parascaris equorum TaxID=6256 RepID=A0A914RE88_PAREQ
MELSSLSTGDSLKERALYIAGDDFLSNSITLMRTNCNLYTSNEIFMVPTNDRRRHVDTFSVR